MASEDVRIAAPVHISNDSAQRVAYDLMIIINQQTIDDKQQPRDKRELVSSLCAVFAGCERKPS